LLLLQVRTSLTQQAEGPRQVQVVTGFLGKGVQTGAITTLGRGGSDLSATVLGAAMELREVQVCCCLLCASVYTVQFFVWI
jgi:aspartate kinase